MDEGEKRVAISEQRQADRLRGSEVDYKTKSGTAWSHSYLNQKPWHPLSYPNQRRKWIAEQSHANRLRRSEEVAREYAQEQEFFRQTALASKKDKEKLEMMKAVSFMYVRPPGYNAESAKAAEIADHNQDPPRPPETNKPRLKDVFGHSLPTEEEFEVLKNAPRLETGVPGRVKPFGVEVRNVKCLRCGKYGHQSGDRECPLKDAIMPNEQSRLERDDPLTAILVHTDPSEPLKWELKQKPGISPPRGGFKPDDPNQQIVAEDIFDEYGGFLSGGNIPELLTNFSSKPRKKSRKKSTHKMQRSSPSSEEFEEDEFSSASMEGERSSQKRKHNNNNKTKKKKKKCDNSASSSSDASESQRHGKKSNYECHSLGESETGQHHSSTKERRKRLYSSEAFYDDKYHRRDDDKQTQFLPTKDSNTDRRYHKRRHEHFYHSSKDGNHDGQPTREGKGKRCHSHQQSDSERQYGSGKQKSRREYSRLSVDSDSDRDRYGYR